nr:MAG TPA_asm: hypothetical protein [Caudoviricetes sp.]DAZ18050.1 MAG TPA: hypothetical protein [Caudoviricetes sp.]
MVEHPATLSAIRSSKVFFISLSPLINLPKE